MYTQNQQPLQTRLFGSDATEKVIDYLKSHLPIKPSLQARLLGRAKSLEDFAAECKRRKIEEVRIYTEHNPSFDVIRRVPVSESLSADVYLCVRDLTGELMHRGFLTSYFHAPVLGGGLGDGYHPSLSKTREEEEKGMSGWKELLEKQGLKVI